MYPTLDRIGRASLAVALAAALLTTGGCATRSRVSASNEIATARFAIRDARTSGAETYAAEDLRQAEALLAEAGDAGAERAERLAELATAHAQLASAKAARQSARKRLAEAESMGVEAELLERRTLNAVEDRVQ